jgi:hypothetical protein
MPNEKMPIDLGKPMGGPMSKPEPMSVNTKEKYYPCLYLDWDDEYDLPESGVMEVRFVKKSETTRTNSEGKSQSVELEIREILDVEAEADEEEEPAGDVLDKYRKETK